MNMKQNLPRGRVLQVEWQLGRMPSMTCWCEMKNKQNLHVDPIYTQNLLHCNQKILHKKAAYQINMTLTHHTIKLSHLRRKRTLQNTGFKPTFQKHLFYSDIKFNCNRYPFHHPLLPSPREISKCKIKTCSKNKARWKKSKPFVKCAHTKWRMAWVTRSHIENTFDTLTQQMKWRNFCNSEGGRAIAQKGWMPRQLPFSGPP